jgi:ribosomal protein L40E
MSQNYIFCPTCNTVNDALARTCTNCGESLIVVCPRCNTVNPVTAEKCFSCDLHFDTLGHIIARHEVRYTDRFTRQATSANEIAAVQKAGDQARSQEIWAEERRRQEYLQAQKLRQKQQERYLYIGVAIFIVLLLAIVLAISLAR